SAQQGLPYRDDMGVSSSNSICPGLALRSVFRGRRSPLIFCDAAIRGRPQLQNLLKIRFERYQEASGLAARHNAMVEGERQREHAPDCRLAQMRNHPLGNQASADDRHLRRYDDQYGEWAYAPG